jgi:hypothetical protein
MKSHIVLRLEDFSEIAEWKAENAVKTLRISLKAGVPRWKSSGKTLGWYLIPRQALLLIWFSPVKHFELSDYVDVLAAVGEADLDLIMVRGNAVSFYAEKYRLTCSELNPLLPVLK